MKQFKQLVVILAMALLTSCTYWRASDQDIHNTNSGNVGIGTINPDSKLTVVDNSTIPASNEFSGLSSTISSPTNARAIYGEAINPEGTWNYGGYFTAAGESSGVFGEATDPLLGISGGVFHSHGKNGKGVIGLALNDDTNVTNYGGWFEAKGSSGVGIYSQGGTNGFAAVFNGKVQIDGSSAISNYQRVTRWAEGGVIVFPPDKTVTVIAHCPSGTKALGGGGGFHQHSGPIAIIASHSYSSGYGWIVWFKNIGSDYGSADLYAEAICATVD